jgi:4-hydroxyphenylpyruvate dioxygenase
MASLLSTGYDGLLSLEIFNDEFRSGSARSIAVDGHRSLIYLLDEAQKRAKPKTVLQAPLPARAHCLGTSFIEFAVEDATASRFEALLSGLGFKKAGRHLSKAVTRWTQGGINIVTNLEKEGFAHSFNVTHGTAVCAIGLDVDDAAAAMDRAERLLDTPFRQPVGPGELQIPAVRGLGGSLLYFIDGKSDLGRVWDIEFRPLPSDAAHDGAGLTRVDHISQSMHYEEMLSWLLFYTSLFDLEKLATQDVLDPGGLVKSLVVQTGSGSLRLPMNASQSGRTQSSRFLSEAFGSGVQHIAFATDDIFATAERLKANGVAVLKISENYYDDLEAKTDLTSGQIDRLKALNILYERDGAGEYFQFYTTTFEDRFFFEVVERRGGYPGLGATNAQVRLTAQAREARPLSVPRR